MERRLAAILVADIVGYSRLMNADEEGTLRAVKDTFKSLINPKAAQYHGRIIKLLGDGALMEFASAVDAVAFAVEVQCAMRERNRDVPDVGRIEYRVGINIGDIIIEPDDIYGDGVNIAARLEGQAEPGGICVAANVVDQVKRKLDLTFNSLGEREVKNIADPVPVYRLLLDHKAERLVTEIQPTPSGRGASRGYVAAGLALLLVIGGIIWWQPWGVRFDSTPGKFSIIVLPFENLTADPEQAYFADAVTEDLITDLSRIRGAFVIASSTSFTYSGKQVSAKEVADLLGVRYVLEGSVRRSDKQVRVNVQLIDGETGAHIWSERFDRDLKGVFALQSDITEHIASVLRVELLEAEARRPKPGNLEAWDYALKGHVLMHRIGGGTQRSAKELFEKALALDSKLALAWEGLAWVHFSGATREIPGVSLPNSSDLALEAGQRAIELDPKSSKAHRVLGMAYYWKGQGEKALAACSRALDLNRNNDYAVICVSRANFILGNLEESIRFIERSQRLNPQFLGWLKDFYIGTAHFYLGRFQEAKTVLRKATAVHPKHASVKLYLLSSLAMLGREDEARGVLADYMKLARGKRNTIAKLRADRAHIVPDFERLAQALRKVGFPE